MTRYGRTVVALVVAGVVLAGMAWFDGIVVGQAGRDAAATFDPTGASAMTGLGSLVAAGGILAVVLAGWRSQSILVGVAYVLLGMFRVFLSWITWTFAAQVNDKPPILPDPFPGLLADLYRESHGPLNAVGMLAAVMAVTGIAIIVRELRHRPARPIPAAAPVAGGQPLPS
jgi:hypothetical protein